MILLSPALHRLRAVPEGDVDVEAVEAVERQASPRVTSRWGEPRREGREVADPERRVRLAGRGEASLHPGTTPTAPRSKHRPPKKTRA